MTSSILVITGNDLSFASLGGKYLRLDLNQLGQCHARHTKIKSPTCWTFQVGDLHFQKSWRSHSLSYHILWGNNPHNNHILWGNPATFSHILWGNTHFLTDFKETLPYHMGAVSVLKTDIKGDRLPHFTREKKGDLRQAFPPIYNKV